MQPPKVLIADSISQRGIDELSRDNALDVSVQTNLTVSQLLEIVPEFSAIVVRSQTKVTADLLKAGTSLRVVGRAGVGVDNVDVEAATRRGVVVLNAPGGNTVSTAEHAFSLLLCVARKIPQADASVRGKNWDRKNFEGVELYNKTLGIIGMGRIGSELARRAIAFGMRVIAYDPYLSATRARALQVELVDELDDLLAGADFISLHTPLTPETRHLLDAARLQKTKRGVRIINCARGGLIDETALANALQDRHIAAAAIDVFEKEPLPNDSALRSAPNLILTPHLGASTAEAQESVGIEIAQSIRAALLEGTIRNAVNMPNLDAKTLAIIGPHLRFGEKLGRFLSQIAPKRVDTLNVNYSGKVNEVDTTAITRSILKGFLQMAGGTDVNEVNAPAFAESLGLKVTESRLSALGDYTDLLELSATAEGKTVSVGGAFFGVTPRIVSINSRPVEARPHGVVLVLENTDRPGMVGRIGTLLGKHGVNIATMSLSRNQAGGTALTVLNLDTAPEEALLEQIRASEDIHSAQVIKL
ncbi:MAG TPA: phosphoglycerate dehydrogenase [Candidatus Sulfotelmatobacter sp.]|jgi:D-3-phosphoglycerate dehydrogenase / 2-oxoglutarate reductase|nr:phosphoglycerate dehydrogenase [Candidatus Sulfotelmatobacter sp.]